MLLFAGRRGTGDAIAAAGTDPLCNCKFTTALYSPLGSWHIPRMRPNLRSTRQITPGIDTAPRSVVSLFSGAGGLDLGLEAAGWKILAQVEMDGDCVETLGHATDRRPYGSVILPRPLEEIAPADLRKSLGLRQGQLDMVAGGPPCQPFTTSGLRRGITDARASSLFPAYFKFLEEFWPRSLLIENVDGMLSTALRHRPLATRGKKHPPLQQDEQKGSFLKWVIDRLVSYGYSIAWGVVEAADFGVPQMRQRAILIGVRGSAPCFLPQPEFGWRGLPPYRTSRWGLSRVKILGPVQPLSHRKQSIYALIPPGSNWRSLPQALQRSSMGAAFTAEGGKSGWWRRLSWDSPAPTILGMPDHSSTALIHPDEVRCLSVNECAALQTFPPSMRFGGSPRSQYQQIGNAVPVLLGKRLGQQVMRFLQGARDPQPAPPPWRQASANRRIGTHGWAVPSGSGANFHLNAQLRPDHVWYNVAGPLTQCRREEIRVG